MIFAYNVKHNPQGLTPNNKIKTALTPVGVDAFVLCLRESVVSTNAVVAVGCPPADPSFHADSGHWYLSKGIVGINNISFIRKPLLNE